MGPSTLATPASGLCKAQVWPEASHTSGGLPAAGAGRREGLQCSGELPAQPPLPQCSQNRHLSL